MLYVYMHVSVCMHGYVCICVCVHMCICACMWVHKHMHVRVCVWVWACTYIRELRGCASVSVGVHLVRNCQGNTFSHRVATHLTYRENRILILTPWCSVTRVLSQSINSPIILLRNIGHPQDSSTALCSWRCT